MFTKGTNKIEAFVAKILISRQRDCWGSLSCTIEKGSEGKGEEERGSTRVHYCTCECH